MSKQDFIDTHMGRPEYMQRWPNYKMRKNELARMYDSRGHTPEPVEEAPTPEPEVVVEQPVAEEVVGDDDAQTEAD